MPKLQPKEIQKQLDAGQLWPVYWIYGPERMKSRELVKRIRQAAVRSELDEETLDGHEVSAASILDAAQSLSLGGGLRLILIREAHALKDTEVLTALFGPPARREELTSVCVFVSKDLDQRKKFSKALVQSAAVIACDEVADGDREAWIDYLAKRRGVHLPPEQIACLRALDPWSLDLVDLELDKISLAMNPEDAVELLQGNLGGDGKSSDFVDAFFRRNLDQAMPFVKTLAERPDESIPLVGLLAWNVRQLGVLKADQIKGTRTAKLNPYLAERFRQWSRHWSLDEIIALDHDLARFDFDMKQTRKLPAGLWTTLLVRHSRPGGSSSSSSNGGGRAAASR